jgi:hypothetical protein
MFPPDCGEAVNVTFVPWQMTLPTFGEIDTEGVTVAFTVIVSELLTAVFCVTHVAFPVRMHVIMSPDMSVDVVMVSLLVPVLTPFFIHW